MVFWFLFWYSFTICFFCSQLARGNIHNFFWWLTRTSLTLWIQRFCDNEITKSWKLISSSVLFRIFVLFVCLFVSLGMRILYQKSTKNHRFLGGMMQFWTLKRYNSTLRVVQKSHLAEIERGGEYSKNNSVFKVFNFAYWEKLL